MLHYILLWNSSAKMKLRSPCCFWTPQRSLLEIHYPPRDPKQSTNLVSLSHRMKLLHIILQYLIIPQFSERDLVGINADTSRLVVLASVSDFDENLPLSRGLLRKHPHLQLYSRLLDSHIYVLRKWVCDFLGQERYVFFFILCCIFFLFVLKSKHCTKCCKQVLRYFERRAFALYCTEAVF